MSGTIPNELAALSRLKVVDVGTNSLTGTIPPSLGYLSDLERIRFDNNNLSGEIPSSLANLSLAALGLYGNDQLHGDLNGFCDPGSPEEYKKLEIGIWWGTLPAVPLIAYECNTNRTLVTCSCCDCCRLDISCPREQRFKSAGRLQVGLRTGSAQETSRGSMDEGPPHDRY